MEVILLEKIRRLGDLGDKVRVKPGFGRNYLIPQGKAVPATAENVAQLETKRVELEKTQAEGLAAAKARAEKLNFLSVTIRRKAGSEGKLYGSVGTSDIAEAAVEAGVELAKHEVKLPNGPYRVVGEYEVDLNLHADVDARIKVSIVPEE
ncbi:MAG: 50S ribosomal protein L9 [Gammaproteobacteria bacterium]|nr:50S ribosomal protein L9 [Gammaproteobacteria bacterium]